MELNVTALMNDSGEMSRFSDSIANSGLSDIGRITWDNANNATEYHLLKLPSEFQAARDYFAEFGAWSTQELDAMSETEVNALLLQFLAGDIREMEVYDTYEEYETAAHEGSVSGTVYRGDDGQWYAYIGM